MRSITLGAALCATFAAVTSITIARTAFTALAVGFIAAFRCFACAQLCCLLVECGDIACCSVLFTRTISAAVVTAVLISWCAFTTRCLATLFACDAFVAGVGTCFGLCLGALVIQCIIAGRTCAVAVCCCTPATVALLARATARSVFAALIATFASFATFTTFTTFTLPPAASTATATAFAVATFTALTLFTWFTLVVFFVARFFSSRWFFLRTVAAKQSFEPSKETFFSFLLFVRWCFVRCFAFRGSRRFGFHNRRWQIRQHTFDHRRLFIGRLL